MPAGSQHIGKHSLIGNAEAITILCYQLRCLLLHRREPGRFQCLCKCAVKFRRDLFCKHGFCFSFLFVSDKDTPFQLIENSSRPCCSQAGLLFIIKNTHQVTLTYPSTGSISFTSFRKRMSGLRMLIASTESSTPQSLAYKADTICSAVPSGTVNP